MPHCWIRCAIHAGVGALGSKPLTLRPENTSHRVSGATSTGYASSSETGSGRSAGSVNGTSNPSAASRATPRSESA